MAQARDWSIELDVRDDAPRVFVSRRQLPDAQVGDRVRTVPTASGEPHAGVVVDFDHDATSGEFVVVSFEAAAG